MTYPDTKFDISDVLVFDNTSAILEVAGEIIEECAPDPGNTRLERLARWVVLNVGEPPIIQAAGALAILHTSRVHVIRIGERVSLDLSGRREFSPREAREVAGALIRAAEMADH